MCLDGRCEKTNQQVITNRWWSFFLSRGWRWVETQERVVETRWIHQRIATTRCWLLSNIVLQEGMYSIKYVMLTWNQLNIVTLVTSFAAILHSFTQVSCHIRQRALTSHASTTPPPCPSSPKSHSSVRFGNDFHFILY